MWLHNSEWFGVKSSILEKLTESEWFTVAVIGTRHPEHLIALKAKSHKVNASNGYKYVA